MLSLGCSQQVYQRLLPILQILWRLGLPAARAETQSQFASHFSPDIANHGYCNRPAAFSSYTAIGDSYAAGAGPFPLYPGGNVSGCDRTTASYPVRFNQQYGSNSSTFTFLACSGANTTTEMPEIEASAFGSPDLVTVNAGGNNGMVFADTVLACILSEGTPTYNETCGAVFDYASLVDETLEDKVAGLLQQAQTKNLAANQTRTVVLVGYAQFYNISGLQEDCPSGIPTPPLGPGGFADLVNKQTLQLNAVLASAAYKVGAIYADIDPAFSGHRICDAGTPYFQTNLTQPNEAIYHPTYDGYGAMVETLARSLGLESIS